MRHISVLITFTIMLTQVFSAESNPIQQESLFMNDEESHKVLSALENFEEQNRPSPSKDLKVTGIFFVDDSNWVVWINDTAYSSVGQKESFSIDEVNENEVIITKTTGETLALSVGN